MNFNLFSCLRTGQCRTSKRQTFLISEIFHRLPQAYPTYSIYRYASSRSIFTQSQTINSLRMTSAKPVSRRILVIGAGNFGSCLADHLADSEHHVLLWGRDADVVKSLNETHRHPRYLKDHTFPDAVHAIGPEFPSQEVVRSVSVILFAIPTQGLRNLLAEIRPLLQIDKLPLLIFVNKGIEAGTKALTLEIIVDTCGKEVAKAASFLSGPSFAKESICGLVVASKGSTGDDPIGVEIAGAMKNVYAIAAGAAEGMGYANNTRAGLITRSLAEMTRIGCAYGGSPLTFLSLAGVGDLFLTCSSPNSRNYTVGHRLGKGEQLDDIIQTLGSVAEGVTTAKGLHEIIKDLGIHAPIADAVYEVLYEGKSAAEMAHGLMARPIAADELGLPERAQGSVAELMRKLGIEEVVGGNGTHGKL